MSGEAGVIALIVTLISALALAAKTWLDSRKREHKRMGADAQRSKQQKQAKKLSDAIAKGSEEIKAKSARKIEGITKETAKREQEITMRVSVDLSKPIPEDELAQLIQKSRLRGGGR